MKETLETVGTEGEGGRSIRLRRRRRRRGAEKTGKKITGNMDTRGKERMCRIG